jgi:hypothetical protein
LRLSIAEGKITPSVLNTYENFRSDKNAARTSQLEKGIPLKTITWRNNKKICKSASQIFQLTLRERVIPYERLISCLLPLIIS